LRNTPLLRTSPRVQENLRTQTLGRLRRWHSPIRRYGNEYFLKSARICSWHRFT